MKAERRHQLKENSLSLALLDLPGTIKEHSSTILLCLSVIFLVFALFYYRTTTKAQGIAAATQSLATAREALMTLKGLPPNSPEQYATMRRQSATEAESLVNQVMNSTSEPRLLAEALLVRGDLNWELANSPELPGAATRPSLKMDRSSADYLGAASDAYAEVLAKYGDRKASAVAARFGLAAVAENKRDFESAKKEYETIANDPGIAPVYKAYATDRLRLLPQLQAPIRIGTFEPTTQPSVAAAVATTRPTTGPTTTSTAR